MSYLNAKRWENFLRANLPQLDKFYLKKTVHFADDYPTPMYLGERNEFSSTYWLEKRWIFKVENDFENLISSIKPYKKNWADLHLHCKDCQHAESLVGLILTQIQSKAEDKLRLFSFAMPKINNNMDEYLTKFIRENQLLDDFTVEQIKNDVYIKWTSF
ncbi:unnamed protein product [Adineta ricciae]|uniref:Uncharacterized protein n=1 Tax=Adineta ricciae TaxID=249248 RepID=A0A815RGD6_ADIRI|nr:unnamed protein product [Adineta ricciae]CAF1477000.1 unnamed protein product [Adineta ricciae]